MKRAWLISFLLFLIFASASLPIMGHSSTLDSSEELAALFPPSDSNCEGNFLLTNQEEYDQFAANHAGCTTFIGDITIDNSSAAIDSVYGLDSLRTMVGNLVVDFAGVPFAFNGMSSLDSLAGDLSLMDHSERFDGLNNLRYAGKILLENTNASPGYDAGDNYIQSFAQLTSCESILISGSTAEVVGNFNQLREAQKIQIELLEYAPIIEQSFPNIITCDSIFIRASLSLFSQNFNNLTEAGFVDLGDNQYFQVRVENSFESLITVDELKIVTNELATTFPSLTHANKIWLEGFGFDYSLEYPLLNALLEVSADMLISVSRRNLVFEHLTQVGGNLTLLNMPVVETVSLPNLTDIEGFFAVGSFDAGSLFNSITAPILTHIGGSIGIEGALLTTCVCPAFCESTNYSPQWAGVNGGPGCSSVEEIQAQCESTTPNCEGNAYITTQAEWDQFAADYAGCTTFVGDITIDNSGAAIDSIIGAENLLKINGDVEIRGEGYPIILRAFNELDSIIGNLTVSISSNLYGFQRLKYVHDILIEDLADQSWDTGYEINGSYFRSFDSLHHCESISILNVGVIQNVLPSVIEVGNIVIEATLNAAFIGETLNNLVHADSLIIIGAYIMDNSFQQIVTVNYFEMGESPDMLRLVSNSFQSLYSAGDIYLASYEYIPTFENLTTVNNIWMQECPADLGVDLELFPNLASIQGNAFIFTGRSRINFDSLQTVDGYLIITNSPLQERLEVVSLSSLSSVGDGFSIVHADSIYVPSLTFIGGQFQLEEYNGENLNFMNTNLQIDSFGIYNCPNLSSCNVNAICNSLDLDPTLSSVGNNAPGCNSIEEIQTQCLGSYASGAVYYDIDCDSEFNNDDALVSYPILLQGDTLPIGSSGEAGYFFVPLELNSNITLFAQHSADWSSEGPITLTTTDSLQVFTDLQIGLCPVTIIHDVALHMNASMDPRPGFTVRYNLVAQNLWPGSDDVAIAFSTAQMPGAVITGYSAGGTLDGNQVSFATNLLYGQSQTLWVDVLVPVGTPLGTAYTATAAIALNDAQAIDNHTENNNYTLAQTVIGSYDPNDKLVTPAVIDLLDIDSTQTATIEYTIRFQNTGTAEAFFVRVLDTLSQALNPATFELIATSHPSEITFHDNHTIEWFFDNIMLPDSFSNEPGSHGFIQFRIQTLPLSEPFALENAAAIYFDFNEPVITPPAVTAVVICAEAGDACDDGDACTIGDVTQTDCSCTGTFADNDNDGICDAEDTCDNLLAGTACDDGNACTLNDLIQADCSCTGTLADSDNDGICDAEDACDNILAGTSCDDLDPCTTNDIFQADCSCIGTFVDTDSDGVCDAEDMCDNTLAGSACDDLDPCTTNDIIQSDCSCVGTVADNDNDGICDVEDVCDNTLAGSACDDLDPCTTNDIFQADCSCLGTFADNDNDGICDAEDACDNTLAGITCDDLDPCTTNDIFQADCSCLGTFADNDNDGICDAEDACDNTLAGSACDDLDPCTINDQIQSDCSCSGLFADSDNDGICDTAEIAGCTDMDACNYDANATDDDGSCSYVDLFAILGNTNVTAGITEEYSYPGQSGSSFEWIVTPGTITAGQGTSIVSVVWDDAPNGTLQVTETNETNCAGEPVVLQVNITPNSITAIGLSSIRLYPNPAHDQLFVSGNIPASTKMSLFNSIGQCVETGSFQNSIDVRGLAEGMYYLRLELDGTSIRKAFTIIDQ